MSLDPNIQDCVSQWCQALCFACSYSSFFASCSFSILLYSFPPALSPALSLALSFTVFHSVSRSVSASSSWFRQKENQTQERNEKKEQMQIHKNWQYYWGVDRRITIFFPEAKQGEGCAHKRIHVVFQTRTSRWAREGQENLCETNGLPLWIQHQVLHHPLHHPHPHPIKTWVYNITVCLFFPNITHRQFHEIPSSHSVWQKTRHFRRIRWWWSQDGQKLISSFKWRTEPDKIPGNSSVRWCLRLLREVVISL